MEEKFEKWYIDEGVFLCLNLGLEDNEQTKTLMRTTWSNGYFESES